MNVTSKELKALGKSFENEFPVRAGLIILAAAELARLTAIEQAAREAVRQYRDDVHHNGVHVTSEMNRMIDALAARLE